MGWRCSLAQPLLGNGSVKLTMKTKKREPRVGDLFTSPLGGHVRIEEVHPADESRATFVVFDDGSYGDWPAIRDGWLSGPLRLVTTGARTLAELEAAGELPDINDDDRTPLEKMTAERDALRERVTELEASSDMDYWRPQYFRAHNHLAFARAFAASQGRVIRELKADGSALADELAAAVAFITTLRERIEAEMAHRENVDTDLAEVLDALRGMVDRHCEGILAQPGEPKRFGVFAANADQRVAAKVLSKHGVVENWDGRYADWARDDDDAPKQVARGGV